MILRTRMPFLVRLFNTYPGKSELYHWFDPVPTTLEVRSRVIHSHSRQHHNATTILTRTPTTKLFFLSWNPTLFSYSSVWFYLHLLQSSISSSILSRTSPILDNCKAQSEGVWSWVTSSRLGNWANWDYGRSGRRNSGKYLCLRFSSTYAFVSSQ